MHITFGSLNIIPYISIMKRYYEQWMGGKIKYTVNFHDGVQTHKDGSPFYGVAVFKNKRNKNDFVKRLVSEGYTIRPNY